uniref:kinesin-like protein KIF22 isoform X2 n=1 Tax=Pristiophorus japonicus TaxID=55135 RepID=UPI00398E560A
MASRVPLPDPRPQKKPSHGQVQVAVRLRPYLAGESGEQRGACVRGIDARTLEIMNWRNRSETMQYNFDAFHGEDASQQEVYIDSVKPILTHVLNGQNASVFAYGPTGAGKTHTMLGNPEQPGVVPRAVLDVFRMSREQSDQLSGPPWSFAISMSYLEIYQEKVLDLLETRDQDLPIREDKDKNIFIPNLTQQPISSFADFERYFLPATQRRTTASTKLNCRSSRSHSVLLIKDSLGGTAHSVMIANIAPEYKHYYNTLTALNFAAKSKMVVNRPFVQETIQPLGVQPPKRPHDEHQSSYQEPAKMFKSDDSLEPSGSEELSLSPLLKPGDFDTEAYDSDVMERLSNLENMLRKYGKSGLPALGTPKEERVQLLKKLEESRLQIQKLEQRQKELEKAIGAKEAAVGESGSGNILFKNIQQQALRKTSVAKHRKQAIVTPLQRLDNSELLKTGDVIVVKRREKQQKRDSSDAENEFELTMDLELAQKQKDHILHILNTGSLKELKTLQRVGDKTAKLIMGWREHNGPYSQIEDLGKVGMSAKLLSTFMKANVLSCLAK